MRPIRVVVVEESSTERSRLRRVLEAEGDIVVVGEAATADDAVAAVSAGRADVVTVDLCVPGGGKRAIERIMRIAPRPILLLGRIGGTGPSETVDARDAGAADVLPKPADWDEVNQRALRRRVRALRSARLARAAEDASARLGTVTPLPVRPAAGGPPIVAIGASTGGPTAVAAVLRDVPRTVPVLVVQHIGAPLVQGLVEWLSKTTGWPVGIAVDGQSLVTGQVVLGPPGRHLTVDGAGLVRLKPGGTDLHQPSADRLFRSLAASVGPRTVAALLTGMGTDGADGLLAVREAGGVTFAQDEASSAVFGMAKAAIERGAAGRVAPLGTIGALIARSVKAMQAS